MGMTDIFNVTGSALNAQSIYLDMIARNMANSQMVSGSEAAAYKSRTPVFEAILNDTFEREPAGIRVDGFRESMTQIERQRMPGHPMADAEGYVYLSNVNLIEEMANMMQASRTYQSNVEVMNTAKQLMLQTLRMGQ